jgi:hypothetical protein
MRKFIITEKSLIETRKGQREAWTAKNGERGVFKCCWVI